MSKFPDDNHTINSRENPQQSKNWRCEITVFNRMTNDLVVCNDSEESRTTKIFQAVTEICQTFDLSEPIWLDINIRDFKRHSKTRFTQDNFIDSIDFDYLEIQVIEED